MYLNNFEEFINEAGLKRWNPTPTDYYTTAVKLLLGGLKKSSNININNKSAGYTEVKVDNQTIVIKDYKIDLKNSTVNDMETAESNLSKANDYLEKNSKYILPSEMVKQGLKK